MLKIGIAVLALTLTTCTAVRGDFVETFDGGSNDGWRLTTNSSRFLRVEPSGGNPGAYLHGQVESAVPTWYLPLGTTTPFLGDYQQRGVTSLGMDLNIFNGNHEPNRSITLDLRTTLGTGNFARGLEAYYVGPSISNYTPGWASYDFPLDANSATIPAGWVLLRGDGSRGSDADWGALMRDVETLGFELGQPGYFYTNHTLWDLGLDNVRLLTAPVPEPASLSLMALGIIGFLPTLGRRVRRRGWRRAAASRHQAGRRPRDIAA